MLAFDSLRLYTEEHNLALTLQAQLPPEQAAPSQSGPGGRRYVPRGRQRRDRAVKLYELIELDEARSSPSVMWRGTRSTRPR